jgi:hypothetical protein
MHSICSETEQNRVLFMLFGTLEPSQENFYTFITINLLKPTLIKVLGLLLYLYDSK